MKNKKHFSLVASPEVSTSPKPRHVRSLLVATALGATVSALSSCYPVVYANPKGCRYENCGFDESEDGGENSAGTADGGGAVDSGETLLVDGGQKDTPDAGE